MRRTFSMKSQGGRQGKSWTCSENARRTRGMNEQNVLYHPMAEVQENDLLGDIADLVRQEIVRLTRDPKGAQLIIPGVLAELEKALLNTDWHQLFEDYTVKQRIVAMQSELPQLVANAQKSVKRKHAKRSVPKDLPSGTMYARDFWNIHGVSHGRYRCHVERGMQGDFPETTERAPYPDTRPYYKERFVTPDNRDAIFAFWDRHGVTYTKDEENTRDA
jgi:hypothetical protein